MDHDVILDQKELINIIIVKPRESIVSLVKTWEEIM